MAHVLSTPDVEVIAAAVRQVADASPASPSYLRRGIVARGLGRSYGDHSCNGGGIVNQLAVRMPDLAAGVPFYGRQPNAADTAKINAPLMQLSN